MQQTRHVLLTGNESPLVLLVKDSLQASGYRVSYYYEASAAFKLRKSKEHTFWLVAGHLCAETLQVISKVRATNYSIVIMVIDDSVYTSETDIAVFRAGADCYLPKPFILSELFHRLRRMQHWMQPCSSMLPGELSVGHLRITEQTIFTPGDEKSRPLTKREAEVISMLIYYKNKIVDRRHILLAIWGSEDYFLTRSLDVVICRLRRILKLDSTVTLETIHGIGFRLSDASGANCSFKDDDNAVINCAQNVTLYAY